MISIYRSILVKYYQVYDQGWLPRHDRHLRACIRTLDLSLCLRSFCRWVSASFSVWGCSSSLCAGPTFGGILFDAVTFRWAIFLVIIAELISLSMLISYLCIELCGSSPPSPPPSLAPDTDQVALLASSSTQLFTKCGQTVLFTSCLDTAHNWRVVVTFVQLNIHLMTFWIIWYIHII